MLIKILVPLLFIGAQFLISWYGYFTGTLGTKGTYLGITYDSVLINSLVLQLKYIWILVFINFLFSMGFNFGFEGYKNFLVIAIIWIASGPIAILLFNALVIKEKMDIVLMTGTILVIIGAISVIAHKEIMKALEF